MIRFKQFLNEEVKLTHLEHVEDILLDKGKEGGYEAIRFLEKIYLSLKNNTSEVHTIQTKVDGAPSTIAGWDPESGKFFVGTKSLFNKKPKINFTNEDIEANHGNSAGLVQKLKEALLYLPSVIKKGKILQGDFMYGQGDLTSATIDGIKCIEFTPNTITYAVPEDTKLASKIKSSKIGIIFHTEYHGNRIQDLSGTFSIDETSFKGTSDVYCRTTNTYDVSGAISFTKEEDKMFKSEIQRLKNIIDKFDDSKLDFILTNAEYVMMLKTYINQKVREGRGIDKNEIKKFVDYVYLKFDNAIEKLKSEKGKEKKQLEKYNFIKNLRDNFSLLYSFFYWHDDMQKIKELLINKLNSLESPEVPYVKKGNVYEPTDPEGFVIASSSENAVKFVNRKIFSNLNMNLGKMGQR